MAHDVKKKFRKQISSFGCNLHRIRVRKGISQKVLAEMANVAYSSINKIENGQLNTTIGTVFALAKRHWISLQKTSLIFDIPDYRGKINFVAL